MGVVLAHTGAVSPMTGFAVFVLSVPLGLAMTGLVIVGRSRGSIQSGAVPATLCMLPLVFVAAAASPGLKLPRINDISTDTVNPPDFAKAGDYSANQGRSLAFPLVNAALIAQGYPDLKPIRIDLHNRDARGIHDVAYKLAKAWDGWTITLSDPRQGIIEGSAETYFFRFTDDFVVRIRQTGDEAIIDMRSKSRVGKGDFGANARRIRNYLRAVQRDLGVLP